MNDGEDIKILQSENETCPAIGYQKASICVPVSVTPFAHAGTTVTTCCGDPVVRSGNIPCPGIKNGSCSFTITQDICVAVPVVFGAEAVVGDTFVNCIESSEKNICRNCGHNEDQ